MLKTNKRQIIAIVATCVAIMVCLTTICIGFNNRAQNTESVQNNGGMVVGECHNNGINVTSVKLMSDEYETYGVNENTETAFVLNATIKPDTAENQGVKWGIDWIDAEESFSSGKKVTDYVTVTPDGLSAVVECLAPFGTKIIVTATSQDNPEIKATCSFDYAQKLLGVNVNIGNIPVVLNGITEVQYEVCPTITGMGGEISVEMQTNDIYTIAQEYVATVLFNQDENMDEWFRVKGNYPMNIQLLYSGIDNWLGESYYFDYANDISRWYIDERNNAIRFNEMTTAEVMEYMSNITSPTLAVMKVVVGSVYYSYTYTSKINCTGFTNNTPVDSLNLNQTNYVF
jgi:hypothetical protein